MYAPTFHSESVLLFLQVPISHGFEVNIADFKNVFCQSHKLRRPQGPIDVQPCSGLPLDSEQLIELVVPVYGLDDAPAEWHGTISTKFVERCGYRRTLLEPCWFVENDENGRLQGMILLDVNGFMLGATPKETALPSSATSTASADAVPAANTSAAS